MMAFLFLLCLIIAICNYFSMRSDQSKRAPFLIGEEPASALESFIVFL